MFWTQMATQFTRCSSWPAAAAARMMPVVHMSVLWRTMEAHTHSVLDLSAVMAHSMALVSQSHPVDSSQEAAGFGELARRYSPGWQLSAKI